MDRGKLWGKSMAELDEDHRQMLADRLQREQAMTPEQLGVKYALPRPVILHQQPAYNFHFGTDIPAPTWQEVEAERARQGVDDAGRTGLIVIGGLVAMLACLGILVIFIALT